MLAAFYHDIYCAVWQAEPDQRVNYLHRCPKHWCVSITKTSRGQMGAWCQLLVKFTQDSFRVWKLLSGPTPTDTRSMRWTWGGFRPNWKGTFKPGLLKVKKETAMREPRKECSRQRESEVKVWVAQSCPTLCNPLDCRLSVSSVHGILQVRILKWVALPSSRESSQPRDQTHISYVSC